MPSNSDKDVVMASASTSAAAAALSAQAPPQASTSAASAASKARDNLEIQEKYRKLKRRFFELEEKHKETSNELQRSGERNVRMREERDFLLERIMELEKQQQALGINGSPGSSSTLPQASALPRTLLNARARTSFEENLRKAIEEEDDDDEDSLMTSRHVASPSVRRDQEVGSGNGAMTTTSTTTTRRTRASNGKAKADIPNGITHASSGPRTRSKRPVEQDDTAGAISPNSPSSSSAKRHKSRPSTSSLPPSALASTNEVAPAAPDGECKAPQPAVSLDQVSDVEVEAEDAEGGTSARPTRQRAAKGKQTQTPKKNAQANTNTARVVVRNEDPEENVGATLLESAPITPVTPPAEDVVMGDPPPSPPQVPAPSPPQPVVDEPVEPPAENDASATTDSVVTPATTEVPETAVPAEVATDDASTADLTKSPPLNPDSNIDPSLSEQPASATPESVSSGPSRNPAHHPHPQHPLSGNPYLSLSTILLPKPNQSGTATPTPTSGHPMFMNPYMYYPSPITPVNATPNTPSYPYNPYFYLTGPPVMPGPPPMYPPGANAAPPPTPTSSTQSRPSPLSDQPPRAKPKRLKAHTVTSKSYSIPLVPRDKNGKPMLPLNVGIMTVINLGDVCLREHFHTERYIFPVGYEVTRRYLSTINPNIEVVYHCTILDGGDGPKFQIVPSDTPDRPVIAGTATGAWSSIVKQANAIRNRQHSNSVSGPDFFGLGQNTIKHLIQELANADRLRDYVWQNFIEGGPLGGRHAAVIPALPEEYDAALPRGPVYHSPLEREKRMRHEENTSPGELPKGFSHYPQHIIAQAAAQQMLEHGEMAQHMSASSSSSHHGTPSLGGGGSDQREQQHSGAVSPNPVQGAGGTPPVGGEALGKGHGGGGGGEGGRGAAVTVPVGLNGAMLMTQSPTPITPNTPTPSLASLMHAYRPPPPP